MIVVFSLIQNKLYSNSISETELSSVSNVLHALERDLILNLDRFIPSESRNQSQVLHVVFSENVKF